MHVMKAELERIARARIAAAAPEIRHSLGKAVEGNPYAAEPNRRRIVNRLQAKAGLSPREAEAVTGSIIAAAQRDAAPAMSRAEGAPLVMTGPPRVPGPENVWGDADFVNVAFLAKGARVARSVGRVAFRNGQPQGSGFLIGAGLFMTNHHVVPDTGAAQQFYVEFDYELDLAGRPRTVSRFAIDPAVFATNPVDGLDFTVFAIGARIDGTVDLDTFGWSGLSDASDKHMLGEFANIVQHPQGRFKEVVLRENRLVSRSDEALHYVADTEPGSSGSPVYNSEWQVISLHHWGGPWILRANPDGSPVPVEINEGIRISAIVRKLKAMIPALDPGMAKRIGAALASGEMRSEGIAAASTPSSSAAAPRIERDGRVSWSFPVELSMRLPWLSEPSSHADATAPAAYTVVPTAGAENKPSSDYSNRGGYKRQFIEGNPVDLPRLTDSLVPHAARNKRAEAGDDSFELKYHHFSVVVNRTRKLAFFTASNIDGATAKSVNRTTKKVTPLRPDDAGLESLSLSEAAEASETWYHDKRLDPGDYAGPEIYSGQRVPGFPDPNSAGRIARMFQRGHLVRRLDPAWGNDEQALVAETDTFHWTNCTPQVGFFNQGSADPAVAGSGRGKLWRAVENYVLRNAVAEKQRVTCFTGPIFADTDREFRGIKVPGRFFKIAIWAEEGVLRSIAMIADQRKVIDAWPEQIGQLSTPAREAFQEPDELDRVDDFLATIAEVESLTLLDFGDAVRAADVRAGEAARRITRSEDLVLEVRRRIGRMPGRVRNKTYGSSVERVVRKQAARK
jgi:endonuclease G, mitochondrial